MSKKTKVVSSKDNPCTKPASKKATPAPGKHTTKSKTISVADRLVMMGNDINKVVSEL